MKDIFKNLVKKNLLWLLIVAMAFAGLFNLMITPPVYAQEAKVFVDPKDNVFYTWQKGVNDTIEINVTIANMSLIAGVEFKLSWDPTLLNCTSMVENLFATVTPPGETDNIWKLKHIIDNTNGYVWYSYLYQDFPRAYTGGYAPINITMAEGYPEGKLAAAILTFKIISAPTIPDSYVECNLDLNAVKVGYPAPPYGPGGAIPCTVEDGYYKLIKPPAPLPLLKVEPETYTATCRNETFNINVTLNNLDDSLKVVGVEFKLKYNPAFLEITNVTEGPFLKSFAEPPNQGTLFMGPVYGSNYVLIGIVILADENGTWHEPFPSGNGTVVTIEFKVTNGPAVSCNLELFDTKIGDYQAHRVNHTKQDGFFTFNVETLFHNIIVDEDTFLVITESNATISPIPMMLYTRNKMLSFNASGADGGICFVNITIPKNLLWLEIPTDHWTVLVEGLIITPIVGENTTHTWLYFTFATSKKPIQILGTGVIPEFSMPIILSIILAVSVATVAITIRSKNKNYSSLKS
jgi:hypothetical protein